MKGAMESDRILLVTNGNILNAGSPNVHINVLYVHAIQKVDGGKGVTVDVQPCSIIKH